MAGRCVMPHNSEDTIEHEYNLDPDDEPVEEDTDDEDTDDDDMNDLWDECILPEDTEEEDQV